MAAPSISMAWGIGKSVEKKDMTEENIVDPEDEGAQIVGEEGNGGQPDEFAEFEADFGDGSQLVQVQEDLDRTKDDLVRSRAEIFNVRQEYGNYVRRTKEEAGRRKAEVEESVVETLLPVLDDIEAARAAGELADGPFASIAGKLEDILGARYGLEQFGEAGEEFDPMLHDALMARTDPEVEVAVIGQVLQPGFRVRDRVLRPAKVIVDNPE